jgi:hypothetical protein
MCVDRDRRQALYISNVTQMAAKTRLIDREIVVERQQHRGDHPLRDKILEASHGDSPEMCSSVRLVFAASSVASGFSKILPRRDRTEIEKMEYMPSADKANGRSGADRRTALFKSRYQLRRFGYPAE